MHSRERQQQPGDAKNARDSDANDRGSPRHKFTFQFYLVWSHATHAREPQLNGARGMDGIHQSFIATNAATTHACKAMGTPRSAMKVLESQMGKVTSLAMGSGGKTEVLDFRYV